MKNRCKIPAILGGQPAFEKPVPITIPTLPSPDNLVKKYKEIISSGMITNHKNVFDFEKKVAEYLGVKYAVAVNSCTSGLMLIMKVFGLKGEVILPGFTFHATAHAVVWNGLKPVFVDCNRDTYNISPLSVEKAITSRTSAVLAVHIFGNPANIIALETITKKYKLPLIFDAAHGFGAKYKDKSVGGFGDAESFSLSPTKLLVAGEGGLVTTNNKELADKVKVGRNYGDSGNYDPEFSGFNARMNEFSAILGTESLEMLEENVERRNKIVILYKALLSDLPGISFQKIEDGNRSSYKDFSILIDEGKFGLSRNKLVEALTLENIGVKKYFYPAVHLQKAFKQYSNNQKLINTENISNNSLSLPLYSHMSLETVKKIGESIQRIYFYRKMIVMTSKGEN